MAIFFYPHAYLRDRHLDTIRYWASSDRVLNPELANRQGAQVSASRALGAKSGRSWKQRIPLLNLKRRPRAAPREAVIYVWGGLMLSGDYIVDLDNPWSLVGYNLFAMRLYRWVIRRFLMAKRCQEIRCLSHACRESLRQLFGEEVYAKALVHYPRIAPAVRDVTINPAEGIRFLFIGTQFDIKGGPALLRAFAQVHAQIPNCRLDVITHLPQAYQEQAAKCEGIYIHPAHFSRQEIHEKFMKQADVLVLPTYMESFGMVALEALAYGLALLVTDVYALKEMAIHDHNGLLVQPPISAWNGVMPSAYYYLDEMRQALTQMNQGRMVDFEIDLAKALLALAINPDQVKKMRHASLALFQTKFVSSHD
jgi:glycosyltransferase involved in cell wall biosynthesis